MEKVNKKVLSSTTLTDKSLLEISQEYLKTVEIKQVGNEYVGTLVKTQEELDKILSREKEMKLNELNEKSIQKIQKLKESIKKSDIEINSEEEEKKSKKKRTYKKNEEKTKFKKNYEKFRKNGKKNNSKSEKNNKKSK